ncbi:Uncharacterized protein BP5553_04018 [Venustampulla echinocandica]|uniref:Uncharacterized protein n=1 Tax=Venustampulla echinocandica TaxID=2656787 RepID=A0A370TW29_9HELO|nr:Uncharacterized protein BP5553_04018 [Venustampulla echinocandica]RDL39678.1 Uncharacterized protein BP5553_04018 [Venustampulla echinocandica]
MLDENLPTFFIKSPSSDSPLTSTIYLTQNASELQPEYSLRRPDPALPTAKNCYAVALYDSHSPDVLYAEVLVQPEWTQPTLSQAEIRAQNGIPPPPVPIVPSSFVIQLYNPDQQVTVRQIAGSWNSSAYWEFEMPQSSFRLPSVSALDRSQSDPAISDVTPKIEFKWKRDGKLSKDISCFLAGKTTDGKKNKEPDIIVAMHKSGKDQSQLTIYEPNMHRVDVEDTKGLEVVFLLGSAVIKDIFFNASRELFNISSPTPTNPKRKNSGPVIGGRPSVSSPRMSGAIMPPAASPPRNNIPPSQIPPQQYYQPYQQQQQQQQPTSRPPPPADPQIQWEIDAETARLKAMVEAEEKERERRDRKEQKRIKKMLEDEEKERRKREAEVAKETERLRKQYGVPVANPHPLSQHPPLPPRTQQAGPSQPAFPQYQSAPHSQPVPVQRPVSTPGNQPGNSTWAGGSQGQSSPYLQAPGNAGASSSGFFGLGGGKKMQKKRSVFF